jgi:membrane protein YdbS with pleckstrin-like domain
MAKPEIDLRPGENVLYQGRPAWRALLSFYFFGVFAAIAIGVICALIDSTGLGVAVGVGILVVILLIGYVRRLGTRYLVTDQRLRIRRGILRRAVQETRLDRVQNVNYDQSPLDRVLSVGTVDFDTAGTDDSDFQFAFVRHPERIVRAVADRLEAGSGTSV